MLSTSCALGSVIMKLCYFLVHYNYINCLHIAKIYTKITKTCKHHIHQLLLNECTCNSQPKMQDSVNESIAGSMEEHFNDMYSCTFPGCGQVCSTFHSLRRHGVRKTCNINFHFWKVCLPVHH